ncbi:hypothetical protein C5O00_01390 [Pukyongia salina]|uniref:Uncharacterized protein n=1 Tax=Pukyongia salina TaxID=2094025 RepID=A0A2S0HUP6_9FLAO|nr:hypothetical protein [Pukyongia salina]AVI49893.1 hypothetical protein C5O00_01390 [Pukyongia salina]
MNYILSILTLFMSVSLFAQVGIGTTNPQATLDVNGTLRINTTDQESVITNKLGGLNNDGTFREVEIGGNLELKNNVLSIKKATDHSFGSIILPVKTNHDVDLLIGDGELNEGKSIIRIYNLLLGESKLTGIKAGYDGQSVWLYPQDGKLKLQANDNNSLPVNHIESNNKSGAKQYGMINIVYDGTRQKWIIMQNNE